MKLKLTDILKPGIDPNNIPVNKIDFNDPEVKKSLERVYKCQKECERRKKIDINKLRNTVIDI